MLIASAAALAAPEVVGWDGGSGADASIVLLYAGEQDGEVGPCGCEVHPKGGLSALATAASVARSEGPPTLLLNPGGWLSASSQGEALAPFVADRNAKFNAELYHTRFDVLNVTYRDLPSIAAGPHPGMVSATHRAEPLPVARYKRFDLGGLDVLVTGVSRDGLPYLQPPGTEVQGPVDAVRSLLADVDADLVVVLAFDLTREAPRIAAIPGVDVLIDASSYPERWPAQVAGDAVWVRSTAQGKAMGELYLWVDQGRVVKAVDRQVTLEPASRDR